MRLISTTLVAAAVTAAFIVGRTTAPQHLQIAAAQTAATPAGAAAQVDGVPPKYSHFKCYQTYVAPPHVAVKLQDQFGIQQTSLGPADMFCAPVNKTLLNAHPQPVPGPTDHLLCYRIESSHTVVQRMIWNQIQKAQIKVLSSQRLCVPTYKQHIGPAGSM